MEPDQFPVAFEEDDDNEDSSGSNSEFSKSGRHRFPSEREARTVAKWKRRKAAGTATKEELKDLAFWEEMENFEDEEDEDDQPPIPVVEDDNDEPISQEPGDDDDDADLIVIEEDEDNAFMYAAPGDREKVLEGIPIVEDNHEEIAEIMEAFEYGARVVDAEKHSKGRGLAQKRTTRDRLADLQRLEKTIEAETKSKEHAMNIRNYSKQIAKSLEGQFPAHYEMVGLWLGPEKRGRQLTHLLLGISIRRNLREFRVVKSPGLEKLLQMPKVNPRELFRDTIFFCFDNVTFTEFARVLYEYADFSLEDEPTIGVVQMDWPDRTHLPTDALLKPEGHRELNPREPGSRMRLIRPAIFTSDGSKPSLRFNVYRCTAVDREVAAIRKKYRKDKLALTAALADPYQV